MSKDVTGVPEKVKRRQDRTRKEKEKENKVWNKIKK